MNLVVFQPAHLELHSQTVDIRYSNINKIVLIHVLQ